MKRSTVKKTLKRTLVELLVGAMLVSNISMYVYAEEAEVQETEETEVTEETEGGETDIGYSTGAEIQEEYNYLDTNMRITFGQIEKGSEAVWQSALFTNNGTQAHQFSISVTDPDMWELDLPTKNVINPGEMLTIYVRPKTTSKKYGVGDYSSAINICGFDSDNCNITASASVNLYVTVYEEKKPWISGVSVYPSSVNLIQGGMQKFVADVEGGDGADTSVTWSISGAQSSNTTIDKDGNLFVGNNETASAVTVMAKSVQDGSFIGYASVSVAAVKNQYSVSVQSSPAQGGSVAGGGVFESGNYANVVANSSNGYTFDGWYDVSGKKIASTAAYSFKVSGNTMLTARFTQNSVRVSVERNISQGGSVTEPANVQYGTNYTVKATPAKGYSFDGWYDEDGDLITRDTQFTLKNITTSRRITAYFSKSNYNVLVTCAPIDGGKISGAGNFNKGAKVTLSAEPANGYEFVAWIQDNNILSTDSKLEIKSLEKDYSIGASFRKKTAKTYTIGAAVNSGVGTISPDGIVNIEEGKSVVYVISPGKSYKISDVKVDGNSVGAVSSYQFNNVNGNHTIVASFAVIDTGSQKPNTTNNAPAPAQSNSNTHNSHNSSAVVITKNEITTEAPKEDVVVMAEEPQVTELSGTLLDMNVSQEEARKLIEDNNDRMLMENALLRGDIEVTVRNMYADIPNETIRESYYDIKSIPNFENVIDGLLDAEQKIQLFEGKKIRANLNICNTDDEVSKEDTSIIQNAADNSDLAIGSYFDVRFIVEVDGVPKLITEMPNSMQVIMKAPSYARSSNLNCAVIRLHDGVIDIIPDEDNDPNTVTFSTDKMSTFAIAYYNGGNMNTDNVQSSVQTVDNSAPSQNSIVPAKKESNLAVYIMLAVFAVGIGVIVGVGISSGKKKKRHNNKR